MCKNLAEYLPLNVDTLLRLSIYYTTIGTYIVYRYNRANNKLNNCPKFDFYRSKYRVYNILLTIMKLTILSLKRANNLENYYKKSSKNYNFYPKILFFNDIKLCKLNILKNVW